MTCPASPSRRRRAELPDGLRMHYVDEGPADAEVVLLLHGQPTWSYLYRTVVARLAAHGLRAVAPDLIGFGRSDKPVDRAAYTVQAHVDWLAQFVATVGLSEVTLVVQDWGGPLGLGVLDAVPGLAPPCGRRQHGAAHRRPRPGRPVGMALPRQPRRHRHGGPDAARLPAAHPGAHAVPAEPVRAGGHRVGRAGRRPGGLRRTVPRRELLRRAAPAAAADGPDAPAAPAPA